MLSNKTLERVSVSYRRGYRDGYSGKPAQIAENTSSMAEILWHKPFGQHDYTEGYKAGANDAHWAGKRASSP